MVTMEVRKEQWRRYGLKFRYGITQEEYTDLLLRQKGLCALCGTSSQGKKGAALCVDHDHETGQIRGLLCHNCNTGLGKFKDSIEFLELAIKYLKGEL